MQQILRDVRDDARKIGELMPGRLASRRDVLRKLVPAVAAELGADGDANVHLVGRKRLPVVRLVPGLSPRLPARLLRLRARRRDDVRGRGTGGIRRVLLQASAEVAILRLKHGDSPLGGRKPRFQRGQTFLQRCTLPAASGPISHVHFIGTQAPRTKGGEPSLRTRGAISQSLQELKHRTIGRRRLSLAINPAIRRSVVLGRQTRNLRERLTWELQELQARPAILHSFINPEGLTP